MSEAIEVKEPLYRLSARFANGELITYVTQEQFDSRAIASETRYMVITSVSVQNPTQCTETTIVNLRDLSFVRSERVTLEQLAAEHRSAGIRSTGKNTADEWHPKVLSTVKFI